MPKMNNRSPGKGGLNRGNTKTDTTHDFLFCQNRHEEQKHGETLPEDSITQEESQEDYKFNYHSAKLTFGLVLLEFNEKGTVVGYLTCTN